MVKISIILSILLVACIGASGFTAEKPGLFPGAKEAQRPAKPEMAYDDPLGRSTPRGQSLVS